MFFSPQSDSACTKNSQFLHQILYIMWFNTFFNLYKRLLSPRSLTFAWINNLDFPMAPLWIVSILQLLILSFDPANGQLSINFYDSSCPRMESIVRQVAEAKFKAAGPIAASATIRLFFHDCFVDGCDGSVLITSTPGNLAERDAKPNLSLGGDGFDSVVQAKSILEKTCPGIVSCADILAVAARDFVVLAGGPSYPVKKGRRDSRVSLASHASANLPDAKFNLDQLLANFTSKGLNLTDLVALSGAHTVGFSHCDQFSNRLYNYGGSNQTDPTLEPFYANTLKQSCPRFGGDSGAVLPFDASTPFVFDNLYYKNLIAQKGLLTSDEVLYTDQRSKHMVILFAKKRMQFYNAFGSAMDKMGSIGVVTGTRGEIRKFCTSFN